MEMITERTLKKWRGDALCCKHSEINPDDMEELTERILKMTQVLLDQHLLRKNRPGTKGNPLKIDPDTTG